jgi:hypothetical protein
VEIKREGPLSIVELTFVAPVPLGNEVIALEVERTGGGWLDTKAAEAVIDVTTGTVYADVGYWSVLKDRGWPLEPPANDPIAALGPDWRAKHSVRGRSRGTLVSTKDAGDTNHACTVLWIAPPDSETSYRG